MKTPHMPPSTAVSALAASLAAAAAPAQAAYVITTVDTNQRGMNSSLQLDAGTPVVSYDAYFDITFRLARCTGGCTDPATDTWDIVRTADIDPGTQGLFTSLQLNGGKPVLSYYDYPDNALRLLTCLSGCSTLSTSTWDAVTIDHLSMGTTSLQLNGSSPVVSYYDYDNKSLKLATCVSGCATPSTATWDVTTVDTGDVGQYSSLQLNAGKPVVSYYDAANGALKLASCKSGCATPSTATWDIATVETGNVGWHTSLQLNGGNPVVSYYDAANGALKLASCLSGCDTPSTAVWSIGTVDSGSVGQYTSLQLDAGNPVVSYYDAGHGALKIAFCQSNCSSPATWTWNIATIDSGNVGQHTSLQLNGGSPVVSYYDVGNKALKLAMDDVVAPTITAVAVPGDAGYGAGQNLDFKLTLSENVTVSGTDSTLAVTVGAAARSAAFQTSTAGTITYRYTVQAGDNDGDGITIGALSLNTSTVRDAAGNDLVTTLNGVPATGGILVDGTAPTVTAVSVPADGIYGAGQDLDFTLALSEAATVTGSDSSLALTVGAAARTAAFHSTAAGTITYRYTVQPGDDDGDGITVGALSLNTTTVRDAAGNDLVTTLNGLPATGGILVDSTAPTVTAVAVPPDTTYVAGQNLDFTLTLSEATTVTGSDSTLALTVGSTARTASFLSGAATTLTYRYTVQAGDNDNDGITLDALSLNTTTVRDAAGNDLVATLNGVAATSGIHVDTAAPTVTAVAVPADGSYHAGQNLDFTLTLSEAATVTGTDSTLALTVGSAVRVASFLSGSPTSLSYRYTVQPGDNDGDGITLGALSLNTTTVRDAAGIDLVATLNGVPATVGIRVDTAAPTVTAVAVPANASYRAAQNLDFTLTLSEAATVIGTDSTLALTVGGTARAAGFLSGTTTSLSYRYTVQPGDTDSDGITLGALTLNTTTVRDAAGNDLATTLNGIPATGGILVDTTAPIITAVAVPPDGSYHAGQNLDFTVTLSESTGTVGTDSVLGLTIGTITRAAAYLSGSANALTYRYTVQSGDYDSDGITLAGSLTLNTTTVRDAAGNDLVTTLNGGGPTLGVRVEARAAVPTLAPAALWALAMGVLAIGGRRMVRRQGSDCR